MQVGNALSSQPKPGAVLSTRLCLHSRQTDLNAPSWSGNAAKASTNTTAVTVTRRSTAMPVQKEKSLHREILPTTNEALHFNCRGGHGMATTII